MNTGIIASRYADALLKYVKETGEGEVVCRQTEILEDALRTSPELVRFLESPALLQATAKVALLQKALGEEKMTASLEKFLLLVIRQDRIPYLRYILNYFRMRWCESIGVSPAKLVVSTPSPGLEERIKGIFNDFTGRKLELKTSVDPSIIGGFIFEVADKRIDASISRQLEELRREFIEKNGRVV